MDRRHFVLLAGVAVAWPAAAQQTGKAPTIGVLIISNPEPFRSSFVEGMRALGYVDGKNIRFEFRNAEGKTDLLPKLAAELVRLKVSVLVASQTPAAHAAKQATSDIPIVISAGDPVGTGLVASLARPGGNVTGMSPTTAEMGGKLLELIREINPSAQRVGVLVNRQDPFAKPFLKQIQDASRTISVDIASFSINEVGELDGAYADMVRLRVDAVIAQPSLQRKRVADLAVKHRLPSVSPASTYVGDGGLLSYSAKLEDVYRGVAGYVDRVLKGTKPAELPIQQASVFELAVNLKTAKAIGVTVPKSILARTDRVIE